MSWATRLSAAKVDAARGLRRIAAKAEELAEAEGIDTAKLKRRAGDAHAALQDRTKAGIGVLADRAANVSSPKFADTIATVGDYLANVPVLSAVPDTIFERHAIGERLALVNADPSNLKALVWAAEALRRAELDAQRYGRIRDVIAMGRLAVGDPTGVVMRSGARGAKAISAGQRKQLDVRLLERAFSCAMTRVRSNDGDRNAWHCLARIYLMQAKHKPATRCARITAAGGDDGFPVFTLARTYLATSSRSEAERAANEAIKRGCTLGYDVLAHLLLLEEEGSASARVAGIDELRRQVSEEDRISYWGPRPALADVVQAVKEKQSAKARALADDVKSLTLSKDAEAQTDERVADHVG